MFRYFAICALLFSLPADGVAEPIRVGVPLSLSGDGAIAGQDMRKALIFANERFAKGRFSFIFEDEKNSPKEAVTIAKRFIEVERVSFILGSSGNGSLIASGPLYDRAGISLIASLATSGDVRGLGRHIFRLFPADQYGAEVLFPYVVERHARIGILTEQDEYATLMERTYQRLAKGGSATVFFEQFPPEAHDVKAQLLRLKSHRIEALILNAGSESSFVRSFEQADGIGLSASKYAVYYPATALVRERLARKIEGMVFADLPSLEESLSSFGREIMADYQARYGAPKSLPLVTVLTIEALRILNRAIDSGVSVPEYLHSVSVTDGLIGAYSFDQDGAVSGINFKLQRVKSGEVQALEN